MSLHDILRQKDARGDVLRHLARHIIALDGVDGGILVRILLLGVLVVVLDQGQNLLVGRVGLAGEFALVAVDDVALGDLMGTHLHYLVLDDVLDLLDRHGAVARLAHAGDFLGDQFDAPFRQSKTTIHRLGSLANGVRNLLNVEIHFLSTALDDLHLFHGRLFSPSSQICSFFSFKFSLFARTDRGRKCRKNLYVVVAWYMIH